MIGIDASATLDKTRDQVGRIARTPPSSSAWARPARRRDHRLLEGWAGDLYGIPVESTIDAIRCPAGSRA